MSTSKITLLSLPNEMLLRVRSHLHSLQDHVYFARTCKTTQSLYNEDFFRFAVRSSGWGRTAVDQKVQTGNEGRAWTTLAGRLVEDARIFQLFEEVPDWSRKEREYIRSGAMRRDVLKFQCGSHLRTCRHVRRRQRRHGQVSCRSQTSRAMSGTCRASLLQLREPEAWPLRYL